MPLDTHKSAKGLLNPRLWEFQVGFNHKCSLQCFYCQNVFCLYYLYIKMVLLLQSWCLCACLTWLILWVWMVPWLLRPIYLRPFIWDHDIWKLFIRDHSIWDLFTWDHIHVWGFP